MKAVLRIMVLMLVFVPMVTVYAQDEVQMQLEALIADIAPADGPAVSARITVGDRTWAAAGGLVDTAGQESATPEAHFRLASMSKTWLAVVVMQLNEQGKLSLDDAAAKWLPRALTTQIANVDQATIRQLLTMTSGIPEYLNDAFYEAVAQDTQHPWAAEEALHYAFDLPAVFAPGEGFEYCNSNYVLLQLIVEAVTGKPMHRVMREQIFEPLKLENTYVQAAETGAAWVHGYEDFDGDGQVDDVTDINDGAGLGDGALISTTADLTRFYEALLVQHTLLSDKSAQMMIDVGRNENEYGIALEVSEGTHGLVIGHTGAVFGFTGAVYYVPELKAIVTILYGSAGLDSAHTDRLIEIAAQAGAS